MDNIKVAEELVRVAKELTGARDGNLSSLAKKVAVKGAEKMAVRFHTDLLKLATKYIDDDNLNPDTESWVDDFMPIMMESAIVKLRDIKKRLY